MDYKRNSNQRNNNPRNNNPRNNNQRNNIPRNNTQINGDTNLFTSPYNFVPFSDRVYEYKETELVKHDNVSNDVFTGEITYEVKTETPICIDDGTGNFHKTADGKYSIPGSTMRGLIRNNVQILGLSSYYEDIDDYALMYRHVAAGAEKNRYNEILGAGITTVQTGNKSKNISILKKVKAGYIKKEKDNYFIYKTNLDTLGKSFNEMNYYVLSERKIINDYLKAKQQNATFSYGFFLDGKNRMQNEIGKFDKRTDRNGRTHYVGMSNKGYTPYFAEISYELQGNRDVSAVGRPGKYKYPGYVISTGYMNEKKVVYIIPKIDMSKERIAISKRDIDAFEIDYQKRQNTLKAKDFFALPSERTGIKPVFYITEKTEKGERLYFGFTPRLRLFYDYTIKDGLNKNHAAEMLDYNHAIFGSKQFKSKVSFSDAVLKAGSRQISKDKVILAEPKPTCYLNYLKQLNKPITYNSPKFELRGVKQYWLHETVVAGNVDPKQDRVASVVCALPAGCVFEGKIRFKNLSQDELGLLLWSVRLNPNCWMNVGKAKSYGYGAISVTIKSARKYQMEEAYRLQGGLSLDPFETIDMTKMIEGYKTHINGFLGNRKIDDLPSVKSFFAMKDKTKIPDNQKTAYAPLSAYRNRKNGLQEVKDIAALN